MVAIPDCTRISHHLRAGSIDMYVTFAARSATVGIDYNAMAEQHGQAWQDNIAPILSNQVPLIETIATDLGSPTTPAGIWVPSSNAGASVEPAPFNVALVANFKTAKRGRSYVGRVFLPGVGRVNLASGGLNWSDAMVTGAQNALDDYKEQVDPDVGDDGKLVVASPTLGTYEDVTVIQVKQRVGTQRRRLS